MKSNSWDNNSIQHQVVATDLNLLYHDLSVGYWFLCNCNKSPLTANIFLPSFVYCIFHLKFKKAIYSKTSATVHNIHSLLTLSLHSLLFVLHSIACIHYFRFPHINLYPKFQWLILIIYLDNYAKKKLISISDFVIPPWCLSFLVSSPQMRREFFHILS